VRIETGTVLRILSTDLDAPAQEIADLYKRRWAIEIVFTQMTKARPLAGRTERDDIADFNLTVGDQDTVNQQFHKLTPLGEVSIGQSRLNPSAEIRGRCCPARKLRLTIDLSFQLVSLSTQRLGFVFYYLAPTLVLRQGNDPELVCLGQTLQLSCKPALALAQLFAPGLEFLRQPPTAMRPGQGLGDVLRLGEQRA